MFALVGPSIGVVQNAGRAISLLRSVETAYAEGSELWRTLDAIQGPLQLAAMLQQRQATLPLFHGAVQLTQAAIREADTLLARDEDEKDEGWTEWLNHKKEGVKRRDAIPKLRKRLAHCMSALQLAFASHASLYPPLLATPAGLRQPFIASESVLEQARELIHTFEMGRRKELLCCVGTLYDCGVGGAGSRTWQAMRPCALSVVLGDSYTLQLRPYPKVEDVDKDDEEATLPAFSFAPPSSSSSSSGSSGSAGLQVRRSWLSDVPGLQAHAASLYSAHQLLYVMGGSSGLWAITFEVPLPAGGADDDDALTKPLSAEAFEAVLTMIQLKHQEGGDREALLADTVDLESREGLDKVLEDLRTYIGEYAALERHAFTPSVKDDRLTKLFAKLSIQ
eukprot:TRINITY_DN31289_c0_g1_i4.p1 TRINITY_DN31289_c0_g1~~TRINITY_DN31289_c0_g1_i4.p1  ORF type:complete len:393 (-),score=106.92 TRINITY_DN31289_c0_g1_i4:371-1549(-)